MNLKDKLLYPILVTVTGGLILSLLSNENKDITSVKFVEPIKKVVIEEKEPDKIIGRFYIQTGMTYDFLQGNLSLTLPTWLDYSNSRIELKLSVKGKETVTYKNLSIGDKIFYENYEITFVDTEKDITTYNVILKILEL